MEWYYLDGEDRKGPFAEADLGGLVEAGEVGPDTLVWNEDMDDWVAAKESDTLVALVPSLKPKKAPPPPPGKKAPPAPGTGASGGTTASGGGSGPGSGPGAGSGAASMTFLGKAAQSMGGGWGGASKEELHPDSRKGIARLEVYGAALIIMLIIGISQVISLFLSFGAPVSAMTFVLILLNIALVFGLFYGGKQALNGEYTLVRVLFIVVLILSGLGVLGGLMVIGFAPLIGLISLASSGTSIWIAILGLQKIGAAERL